MHFGTCALGAPHRWLHLHPHLHRQHRNREWTRVRPMARGGGGAREDVDTSYLDMWKKAVESERKSMQFKTIAERVASTRHHGTVEDDLEKKTTEFHKLLEVPSEERDRVQRMQVIDRAAAAIAAARALIQQRGTTDSGADADADVDSDERQRELGSETGVQSGGILVQESAPEGSGVPGPDFWSWTPPVESDVPTDEGNGLQLNAKPSVRPTLPSAVVEKERKSQFLSIPFESLLSKSEHIDTLPPFQSFLEVKKAESAYEPESPSLSLSLEEEQVLGESSSGYAEEAAHALSEADKWSPIGVHPDGTRWWKDTGIERRPDGVICRWTMTRGVSADKEIEWQEKYWEASDDFGYKELGSEKSGRDAYGNVWREFWRESMSLEDGVMNFEKTADKWGSNGKGNEWQEKWGERYNAAGQSDKWADKWCSIDPNTPLEPGHAHVWHERWGGKYDGYGGSIKYTDKWAERSVDGGWEKWGDKWDENFDPNSNGVKQGESWWESRHGERWNRTWGEHHNGSGWIHKYGKSSSGEHWDTHVNEETWYEKFPHYGFFHCYENSVQLREVPKPSEILEVPKPSEFLEAPNPSESEILEVEEP